MSATSNAANDNKNGNKNSSVKQNAQQNAQQNAKKSNFAFLPETFRINSVRARFAAACVLAAGICAILIKSYLPIMQALNFDFRETAVHRDLLLMRGIVLYPFALLLCSWLCLGSRIVNRTLHRFRWAFGAAIIIFCTLASLHGSSLNIYNFFLGGDLQQDTIFGTARIMRSDEYSVGTPFAISQEANHFAWHNMLLGDFPTNMYIIKDSPMIAISEIFRPFHWGYILFGSSAGLSFYWSARFVVLFLVSYEFFLLVSRNCSKTASFAVKTAARTAKTSEETSAETLENCGEHRILAAFGAVSIACAPLIQWWFAVNNLVEMLIDVFASILLFNYYLRTRNTFKRALAAAGISLCAGSFIWTLYPAWQIPLSYVLAALIVWQIAAFWGKICMKAADWIIAGVIFACFAILMLYIVRNCKDTISASMSTIYPGARKDAGGAVKFGTLFNSFASHFLPFRPLGNAPELAKFADLFPLGAVFALANLFLNRKKDLLSILLLCVSACQLVYMTVGVPAFIAKITLSEISTSERMYLGFAVAQILLFIRSFAVKEWKLSLSCSSFAACFAGAVFAVVSRIFAADPGLLSKADSGICARIAVYAFVFYAVVVFASLYSCKSGNAEKASNGKIAVNSAGALAKNPAAALFVCAGIFSLACTSLFINPVQKSTRAITDSPLVNQAKAVNMQAPGKWVAAGEKSGMIANLLAANGLTVQNAVQIVPNTNLWNMIDPSGKCSHATNRFAYINVKIASEIRDECVTLSVLDQINAAFAPAQLNGLGVRYVFSDKDLSDTSDGSFRFEKMGETYCGYSVWRLVAVSSESVSSESVLQKAALQDAASQDNVSAEEASKAAVSDNIEEKTK